MPIDILVGDDEIESSLPGFKNIPNARFNFVSGPYAFIIEARLKPYSILITDLHYSGQYEDGFMVLEALAPVKATKILWTYEAYNTHVMERAKQLGAKPMSKNELFFRLGMLVDEAARASYQKPCSN